MMSEEYDDDYAYDRWVDEILERHGGDYIADRSGQIIEEYQKLGLSGGICDAHSDATTRANELFKRARRRLAEGVLDEAAFAAFRAVEGYCTSVFILTLHQVLTAPFDTMLSEVQLRANDLLGDSLRKKMPYVELGLLAISSREEFQKVKKHLRAYVSGSKQTDWTLRNRIFHSFVDLEKDTVEVAVASAEDIYATVSGLVQNRIDTDARAREEFRKTGRVLSR
jgi:hypothetical protein